jgi:putative endonuclease
MASQPSPVYKQCRVTAQAAFLALSNSKTSPAPIDQFLRTDRGSHALLHQCSGPACGPISCVAVAVPKPPKRFVYILQSINDPERRYIGLAADPVSRLHAHNAGTNPSTARWKPWVIDVCVEFRTEEIAVEFEKYLKSGSGHAFAKRHF